MSLFGLQKSPSCQRRLASLSRGERLAVESDPSFRWDDDFESIRHFCKDPGTSVEA